MMGLQGWLSWCSSERMSALLSVDFRARQCSFRVCSLPDHTSPLSTARARAACHRTITIHPESGRLILADTALPFNCDVTANRHIADMGLRYSGCSGIWLRANIMVVRVFGDVNGSRWAVTRCEHCHETHKYPANEALTSPLKCPSCGQMFDRQAFLRGMLGTHLGVSGPNVLSLE
jgi:hypothetical protein